MEKELEIIEKAKVMFMKYGLRSITMDDIAKEVSVSKRTLYKYFKDKANLIRKIAILELQKMDDIITNLFSNNENTIDRMIRINNILIEMKKKAPQNVRHDLLKYYPKIAEELNKKIEDNMFKAIKNNHEIGIKEGLIRKNLDTNVVATLQICRANFSKKYFEFLNGYTDEKILNSILEYHIRGVATPKGIEYFKQNYLTTLS